MRDGDKNDWYDPKAYRSDPFDPYPQPPRGPGFFKSLLIWLLIGGGLLLAFQGYWKLPEWTRNLYRYCILHAVAAAFRRWRRWDGEEWGHQN
jgi:hypothetical protein